MTIKLTGNLIFDPIDRTKKHISQSKWKKVAIIQFEQDIETDGICAYYAWFIKKRYNLKLNIPLRGAHVTVINDRSTDIKEDWEEIKSQYNGKKITVTIDLDVRTDGKHWWLKVHNENNPFLKELRDLLGLGVPYYSFHMTIGLANERNIEHSAYINRIVDKFGGPYN